MNNWKVLVSNDLLQVHMLPQLDRNELMWMASAVDSEPCTWSPFNQLVSLRGMMLNEEENQ